MNEYMKKLLESIEKYSSNKKKLEYEVSENIVKLYYDGEHFVDFGESGWMYPINLSENADLNNPKNSNTAYKVLHMSEIMLQSIGILNKMR